MFAMLLKIIIIYFVTLVGLSCEIAIARPENGEDFCDVYQESPHCANQKLECNFCHNSGPPALNSYGKDIKLRQNGILLDLSAALSAIEDIDSDEDSHTNLEEIVQGTLPGDANDVPEMGSEGYIYSQELAYRKVKAIYCGAPASYSELQKFESSSNQKNLVHAAVEECLATDYWKNEALQRLADEKIIPRQSVGSMDASVKIGEYDWDYRLFSHIMTGDRDVRELLTADYHIDENGNIVNGTIPRTERFQLGERIVIAGGQPLQPEMRAGMITTQWFVARNNMFALLPMNTAAQAYRAYLGKDIAKGEGLVPVPGEPRDVDDKGTDQAECAVCHSTLDPLAYPFSAYKSIEISVELVIGNPIGTYDENRTPWVTEGSLLGQPVSNLVEWANVAKESVEFKQKVALDLYFQALNRGPENQKEQEEFDKCWLAMPSHGYSANKLIHCIVDTVAFGGIPES